MKKSLFIICFVLLWAGLAVSQETCSEPCDLQSEISQTSDPMSLQKPPASFWGVTGGCGFGTVTAAGATCWVDATHKWNCTIQSGPSGSYTPYVTYTPGPVPSGCTYPDPASTGQTSIHVDDGAPTVSVAYPANGAWVRREDNMTGEAQDDMQLFHAGAVTCTEPGCSGTGAFNFPAAANIADFQPDKYYDSEKLKSAAWTVPIAGVVTCGVNPQNVKVQVRDSVFHLTEQGFSFNADCYVPVVTITEPPMFGNSWTNPQSPVIRGTASDDGEIVAMSLVIKDEVANRYWNGSGWQAAMSIISVNVPANSEVNWEYNGLSKDDLRSGNFTISAYAKDRVGRVGTGGVTVGYKKRFYLGEEEFTDYIISMKDAKNANRSESENPYSFTTKTGEHVIDVTAEITPSLLEPVLNRYVLWSVSGVNVVSGTPAQPQAGNPSSFYVKTPPVPAKNDGRGTRMGYAVSPRVEYGGVVYSNPENQSIFQDEIDQCRQEYIDMGKDIKPLRNVFVNAIAYINPGDFTFADINDGSYNWVIFSIAQKLQDVRFLLANPCKTMPVNSGYRNPIKNGNTDGSGKNSQHIYGKAADISPLGDYNGDGLVGNRADWTYLRDKAKQEGACVEPYENTGGWVHMDWRGACPNGW